MSEIVNKNNERIISFFKSVESMTALLENLLKNYRPPFDGDHFLTDKEVSALLKISRRTLQDWRSNGKIAYIQLSGKVLYRTSDIDRVLMDAYQKKWK